MLDIIQLLIIRIHYQILTKPIDESSISQEGEPIPQGDDNLLFGIIFVENCMKVKKMD